MDDEPMNAITTRSVLVYVADLKRRSLPLSTEVPRSGLLRNWISAF